MEITYSREKIVAYFKELGFKNITLDLEGYKQGAMNIENPKKYK